MMSDSEDNEAFRSRRKQPLQSCLHVIGSVLNVELAVFLYFVAIGMVAPASQHFIYQTMCLIRYQSNDICANIDTFRSLTNDEDLLQEEYSYYSSLLNIFQSIPSAFVSIFLGIICDRMSFRWPLAVPQLGLTLSTAVLLLYSYIPLSYLSPIALCLPSLVNGFSGGMVAVIVAAISYASKISSAEERTFRIAAVEAAITLGAAVGFLLSGALLNIGGSVLVFIVQIALTSYIFVYIFAMIPELHSKQEITHRVATEASGSLLRYLCVPGQLTANRTSFFSRCSTEPFGKHSRDVILILYANLLCSGVAFGISSVFYEFLTSAPISFPADMYAVLQGTYCGLTAFNLLITVRLIRKCVPSDSALAVIGLISRMLALVAIGLGDYYPTYSPWMYSVLFMGSGFFSVGAHSLISRMVSEDIRGAVFALMGFLETTMNVILTVVFNLFYAACLSAVGKNQIMPPPIHGLVFFVALGLLVPAFIVMIWIHFTEKNIEKDSSCLISVS